MFNALFSGITSGRLPRLPFLGYLLLIAAIMFAFVFGTVALIVSAEKLMSGNLQQIQATLAQELGMAYIIIMAIFILLIVFVSMNIVAKRIRDMGLWGWTSVLVLVVASGIVAAAFPGEMTVVNGMNQMIPSLASSVLQAIVFLCLVLIPGNAFGNKN